MEYCIKYESCHARASYRVTGKTLTENTCGTHLTRVVRDNAAGNDGEVTVKVLKEG